jgi:hypothetical protein
MTRNETIISLYRDGKTLEEIGGVYGISRERVRQLLSRRGLSRRDGGQSVRASRRAFKIAETSNARSLQQWGCSWDQYCSIRGKPSRAWCLHRRNARVRGIGFELTLWQWWTIWRDSGRWPERGHGAEKYAMCRFNDVGPYAVGNVYIATNSQNSKDRFKKPLDT